MTKKPTRTSKRELARLERAADAALAELNSPHRNVRRLLCSPTLAVARRKRLRSLYASGRDLIALITEIRAAARKAAT